jgi:GH25 family lysozyme M1 (1,4-beta-N-acetylmuramidase)
MTELYGIDVSQYDGYNINFATAPIKYCIVRWGYGSRPSQQDKLWEYHLEQCNDNNIPMGAYLYSYATTTGGAVAEATNLCARLDEAKAKGYTFPYWIWYDVEDSSQARLGKTLCTQIVNTFIDKCKELGYTNVGLYTFRNFMDSCLNRTDLHCGNMLWIADYVYKDGLYHGKSPYINYDYVIYQYTSTNSNQSAWDSRVGLDQDMCYYDFVSVNPSPVVPSVPDATNSIDAKKKQIEELTAQETELKKEIEDYKKVMNLALNDLGSVK